MRNPDSKSKVDISRGTTAKVELCLVSTGTHTRVYTHAFSVSSARRATYKKAHLQALLVQLSVHETEPAQSVQQGGECSDEDGKCCSLCLST